MKTKKERAREYLSMKIYQNHYRDAHAESRGYSYHTSKRDAALAAKETKDKDPGAEVTLDVMDYPLTKAGMIRALTYFGHHPDNG